MSYILKLRSVQCQPIRTLFEALKEVLNDCNIHFDKTGMKILSVDGSHVALVHMKLHSKNFEEYVCQKPTTIGVSVGSLFKLLKPITTSDTLTFFIASDNINELGIRIENAQKNAITKYKYKLLDLDDDDINVPETKFDSVITMPSVDFQNYCRSMSNISDTIELKSVGSQLIISCVGDFANQETILNDTKDGGSGLSFITAQENDEIYQGKFPLKYMLLFTKATSLSSTIDLFLKNDYPLLIKYTIANLGELKFALAPKLEDEE